MTPAKAKKKFDFPSEWNLVRIKDYLDFQEGPGVRTHQFTDEGVKLLNVANLADNEIVLNNSNNFISRDEAFGPYKHFLVDEGDLIIASSGVTPDSFVKKIAFAKKEHLPLCMNTSTIRFKIKDNKLLDLNYFKWFLTTDYFKRQVFFHITGSAQLNFGPSHLKQMFFPLIPKTAQKKLNSILEKASSLIKKRKETIRLADEFLRSTFLEMFGELANNPKGYSLYTMKELCNKITDGTHDTPARLREGVKFITGKHIRPFSIDFENSDYVEPEIHNEIFRRCNPEFGDILYTNIGVNVGTAAMNTVNYEFSMKNVALLKNDKSKIKSRYLECLLNHTNMKKKILDRAILGGAQQFLSLKIINDIEIPVADINLQNKFSEIVEKTEKLKKKYNDSLQESENLFNSLMQRAFRGEL